MFQLLKLSQELLTIWHENKGFVVLYSWVQFLKDECLSFLGLGKSLDVSAVEEDQKKNIRRCKTGKHKHRGEALSSVSTQVEDNVTQGVEEDSKPEEEVCTVVDGNSVCDKPEEEDAPSVKLSSYDSRQTESPDEASRKEASDPGGIDLCEMIACYEDMASPCLCCDGPEEGTPLTDVPNADFENSELSGEGQQNSRRFEPRKTREPERGEPLNGGGGVSLGKVLSLPLPAPLWNIILDYNKMQRRKDFEYQMFCCTVCYEVSPC